MSSGGHVANGMQKMEMRPTCVEYLLDKTSQTFRFIANPMCRMPHCFPGLHEL